MRRLTVLIAFLLITPALGVKTSHWVHSTEADFKQGVAKGVVATNLGDLKLSREVKTLLAQDPRVSAVFALAQGSDGTIYAATGPEGILLAVKDDKTTTAAELGPHTTLLSLLVDSNGRLLIGTGAQTGQILRIDRPGEKPKPIFSAPGVQYIWSMIQSADGTIYAGTGPNGQLFQINADGTSKVLLDSDENNLLCLLSDGKDLLYAGTDPNGIVYRVNRRTGELFVLFDAPETEIGTLAMDERGNLFAGTAQATDEHGPGAETAGEQVGRPEGETTGTPIPSKAPTIPAPPPVPAPAPGEPLPIPKQTGPLSLLILGAEDEPAASPTPTSRPAAAAKPRQAAPRASTPEPKLPIGGNAIYRIDPLGFVTEVFRQPVTVFAILEQAGSLLVATGGEGRLYQVSPAAEETLVLAKVDPKDILCMLPSKDGRIVLGLANSGEIAALTPGYAQQGSYTSPVLDAKQISQFGKIQLRGALPTGTTLKIATRSGNVEQSSSPGWSNWSEEIPAAEFVQTASPTARFLQYRLTLNSDGGRATPIVEEINVAYQVPNQAPQVRSIKIPDRGDDENRRGTGKVTISWVASDPNEDELNYDLHFRSNARSPWILLKDKLKDPTFEWDTHNVADGRYEIRVEASDASANPVGQARLASRISEPLVVDNTAPVIGDIRSAVSGPDATITLNVADRASTIARLEYSIDSSENWQTVLPSDTIADSPQEAYEVVLRGLSVGAHQIALRAGDSQGNRAFESVSVTISPPAAR